MFQLPSIGKNENNEMKIVNQIRSLGIDMIQEAKSGHPGIVLGAAPMLYTLYAHHLMVNPADPTWINRDRFVMSAGHGSALLYATLFMAGYPLSLEDVKQFRKFASHTPGHPELGVTPGVDMSTGPLGQGFASAVGMAIGEAYLRALFPNKIDHYTFALCGDGDLMEGISYEAASLAGTLKLGRLIVLYDSNHVCLDSDTKKTFQDDITLRFQASGWNVITVEDGEDIGAIDDAITKAKESKDKPTLIEVKTMIGRYSKYQGSNVIHGKPLEESDYQEVKNKLDTRDIPFTVSRDCMEEMKAKIQTRVDGIYQKWQTEFQTWDGVEKDHFLQMQSNNVAIPLPDIICTIPESRMESTRDASHQILNEIVKVSPWILSGSADVSSSTKTYLDDQGDFSSTNRLGKNIFFGVREHAMAAMANGIALMGLRPVVSTFLSFADYLKPALRLSSLMHLGVIYVFSHDSISVGEDGPTHQPVEQLAMLRSIPNLEVFRPADINETLGSYRTIFEKCENPSALILGRNAVPVFDITSVKDVSCGGYLVQPEEKELQGVLIATGEELQLAIQVRKVLLERGISLRVVSMPSIERFLAQDDTYHQTLLPNTVPRIVIEASHIQSWYFLNYDRDIFFTVNTFGISGSREEVLQHFGFTVDAIVAKLEKILS